MSTGSQPFSTPIRSSQYSGSNEHSINPVISSQIDLHQQGQGRIVPNNTQAATIIQSQPLYPTIVIGNAQPATPSHYYTSTSNNPEFPMYIPPPPPQAPRLWSTTIFECSKDEESCWWGTWCCWLLEARNTHSYGIGSSAQIISVFWLSAFIIAISTLLFGVVIGGLFAAICGAAMAWQRTQIRASIRNTYNIAGAGSQDFLLHCCCSCCSICQETREAKVLNRPFVDFCFGEEISDAGHEYVSALPDGGSFRSHFQAISKTSKLILFLCLLAAFVIFILIAVSTHPYNILIFLLVFVQPFLILYFVYWRNNKTRASLDYVIKMFACGFWLATFQSIVLESILEFFLYLIVDVLFLIATSASITGGFPMEVVSREIRYQFIHEAFDSFRWSQMTPWKSKVRGSIFQVLNYMCFGIAVGYGNSSESMRSLAELDDQADDDNIQTYRKHFYIIVFAMLIMAFVIAAGVEETMKHFVVRCCRFPSVLKNPHAILVYLMCAALGFATSENLEYVFGASLSSSESNALYATEMIVLLIRVLMPIHVICSVLQASRMSEVALGVKSYSIFFILLPAIFLHGIFDFILFLLGAVSIAFGHAGILEVISLVLAAVITLSGVAWAYFSFNAVVNSVVWNPIIENNTIQPDTI